MYCTSSGHVTGHMTPNDDGDNEQMSFNVAWSPKTTRTCNTIQNGDRLMLWVNSDSLLSNSCNNVNQRGLNATDSAAVGQPARLTEHIASYSCDLTNQCIIWMLVVTDDRDDCWQAVSCRLRGLPPDDTQWSRRAADWLMDQINCVIKMLSKSPLTVDVFTADGSQCLVDKMADITDLWDRLVVSLLYCVILWLYSFRRVLQKPERCKNTHFSVFCLWSQC